MRAWLKKVAHKWQLRSELRSKRKRCKELAVLVRHAVTTEDWGAYGRLRDEHRRVMQRVRSIEGSLK